MNKNNAVTLLAQLRRLYFYTLGLSLAAITGLNSLLQLTSSQEKPYPWRALFLVVVVSSLLSVNFVLRYNKIRKWMLENNKTAGATVTPPQTRRPRRVFQAAHTRRPWARRPCHGETAETPPHLRSSAKSADRFLPPRPAPRTFSRSAPYPLKPSDHFQIDEHLQNR